jgi:hypothetical protein
VAPDGQIRSPSLAAAAAFVAMPQNSKRIRLELIRLVPSFVLLLAGVAARRARAP